MTTLQWTKRFHQYYDHKLHDKFVLPSGRVCYIPYNAKRPDLSLRHDLDILIYDLMNSNMDIVMVIDGKEGTGKSQSARVIGAYISTHTKQPFSYKNIHFNTKDYINACEKGQKGHINILDESREALNKRRGMAKENVKFLNWISENRDKCQVHIIILPAIHDLENYITMWRMSLLLHHLKVHVKSTTIPSGWRLVRGFFEVYKADRNLQYYINNKQKYGYYAYPMEYHYRRSFLDCDPFDEAEYKKYKDKKAKKRQEKYVETKSASEIAREKREQVWKTVYDNYKRDMALRLYYQFDMTYKRASELMNCTPNAVKNLIQTARLRWLDKGIPLSDVYKKNIDKSANVEKK